MSDPIDLVAELVRRETGIRVKPAQYPALRAAIGRALPDEDAAGFIRMAAVPGEGRRATRALIDEVTIKETSFFRERAPLDQIDWEALLANAHATGSREIRVWCAACATGEEAYTLALLACDAFSTAVPPVRILATDISLAALAAAGRGRYGERALRLVAPGLRERYFDADAKLLVVGQALRNIVDFAQHNLASGAMPPDGEQRFDLIVCRNVLIYFDSATADDVVTGLQGALQPHGRLILGSADALCGSTRPAFSARPVSDRPVAASRGLLRKPLGLESPVGSHGPIDVETRFLRAIGELEGGEPRAAAESLRHVLYLEPTFGLAAFALGRAQEATGDTRAARRSYQQALRTIDLTDTRHDHLLEQIDLVDVATACRARIASL